MADDASRNNRAKRKKNEYLAEANAAAPYQEVPEADTYPELERDHGKWILEQFSK